MTGVEIPLGTRGRRLTAGKADPCVSNAQDCLLRSVDRNVFMYSACRHAYVLGSSQKKREREKENGIVEASLSNDICRIGTELNAPIAHETYLPILPSKAFRRL